MSYIDQMRDRANQAGGAINYITRIVETPCEDLWSVLIETAFPAAGDALWILLMPSPGEIIESYLQPKPRRGLSRRRHKDAHRREDHRARRRRGIARLRPPDTDNFIADHLPGRRFFRGRQAGKVEQWIWDGIDVGDRLFWYWQVLDATEEFVIQWASGIMESKFCDESHNIRAALFETGTSSHLPTVAWGSKNAALLEIGCAFENGGKMSHFIFQDNNQADLIFTITGGVFHNVGYIGKSRCRIHLLIVHNDAETTDYFGDWVEVTNNQSEWTAVLSVNATNIRSVASHLLFQQKFAGGGGYGPVLFRTSCDFRLIGEGSLA